ncbi:MAG: hypothetical protein GF317_13460 [Candidatus Lokiarchaeota archaeon]|nr:hypothetical protein [Candidatus Lokiarchaeota archaeon]MBD3200645.1 hypothetical protein [Candidatus Lokiarchaeota archaeon]
MPAADINLSRFFINGIHFSCERCGECCKGLNNGEVYLYKDDIVKMVNFLNEHDREITLEQFCKRYVKIIPNSFYWKDANKKRGKNYAIKVLAFKFVGDNEKCPFLDDKNLCTIHNARPFQCRAYPIGWNMLINNVRTFQKYSKDCPALSNSKDNKGEYHEENEIIKWAKKEYEIEKNYFLKLRDNDFDIFKLYKFLPREYFC